jgi:hypothetical protein
VRNGLVALAALVAVTSVACGGAKDPPAGKEGGSCLPNGSCGAGLTCLSTYCVRVIVDAGGDGGPPPSDGASVGDATKDTSVPEVAIDPNFTPAPHPDLPQVGTLGGPVLSTPKVRAILYTGDPHAADVDAFLREVASSSYWAATTAEYGVGPLTVLPPITRSSTAPTSTTDANLRSELAANTTGSNPPWGAADPGVVYLFVVPPGSTVTDGQSTCCDDFGGYHGEATVGATTLPYAVACTCPGFFGTTINELQERTTAMSHELVEAATDPFPLSNPAYSIEDRADILWTVINGGGELGDMCAFNDDAYYVPPGSKYMVQRSWSNAAAKQMKNPCVPYATTAPYFNSFPALDTIPWGPDNFVTRGVHVPVGQSRVVDVTLFSNAPTKGTWTVTAYDYDAWFLGQPAALALSLDKPEGRNGDTLHLTITPKRIDKYLQGEAFVLISHYGTVRDPDYQTNLTISLVTN